MPTSSSTISTVFCAEFTIEELNAFFNLIRNYRSACQAGKSSDDFPSANGKDGLYNRRVAERFVSIDIQDIQVGESLPVPVYLYINFRFLTFRAEEDVIDRATFERLELKKVRNLFIRDSDRPKFLEWVQKWTAINAPPVPENKEFAKAREDVHRKVFDIFQSDHPEKMVTQVLESSKKLVDEVMKFPYAVQSLAQLQSYSRGTVDHSVNVSALAVYLAMQMGYSHQLILQHVGAGALMHDIGKTKVKVDDEDSDEVIANKMEEHPLLGEQLLDAQGKVPNEVKMIVAQHHEAHDGSGYPKRLRAGSIYDLARIVSIANVFDELVGDGSGTLLERQRKAIDQLDQNLYPKFDPQKLDKALKILKLGV